MNQKSQEKVKVVKKREDKESQELENNLEPILVKLQAIGEGGNAYVRTWENTEFENICLKEIKKIPQLRGNDLIDEFAIQEKLFEQGVSVPKPLMILEKQNRSLLFVMNRIHGPSLEDILRGKQDFPQKFELDPFFEELKKEIQKMHAAGVIHRDLRSGNIMITPDGLPVIIDFGTAIEIPNAASASSLFYEETVLMYNPLAKKYEFKTGYFLNDLQEALPLLYQSVAPVYYRKKKGF